jgi:hypothetical protein
MSVRRLALRLVSLLGALVLALVSVAAPALALNPERHYEMVSPPYKDGYAASKVEAVAQDGESVAFFSPGVFAGRPVGLSGGLNAMPYVARRGASGWSTTPLSPPPAVTPDVPGLEAQDVTPTLDTTVVMGYLGPSYEAAFKNHTQASFFAHSLGVPDTVSGWETAGPVLEALRGLRPAAVYRGASANLCHFIVNDGGELAFGVGPLLPESIGESAGHLYEVSRGCHGEPSSLRFVGLDNAGKLISPMCDEAMGLEGLGAANAVLDGTFSSFNAVPAGGQEVFFTASSDECEPRNVYQLFVRVGGVKTLEVSRPLQPACVEVPCGGAAARANAEFVGASRDGSRVFFLTKAPLVDGDEDSGNDLYMATIGCPSGVGEACEPAEAQSTSVTSLVQVSHDAHVGEAAEVQGAVRVAPDGSRAYFVARGLLGEGPNTQGQAPVRGADNLYVYDAATERVAFIADLCSGPGASGAVEDMRCPADLNEMVSSKENDDQLWTTAGGARSQAQTAGASGDFLVFSSYGQLVPSDTDTARDVYRYDAETGALERVSAGENGYDSNGNDDAFNARIASTVEEWAATVVDEYAMNSRAISEDGSRIVFSTAGPLSPGATNGLANVYEWHQGPGESEGKVSLISGGSGSQPVEEAVISVDGRNVFFVTSQGLVAQDTDGAADVYDARLGEGFPEQAAPPQECSGDACQGPLTNPAPLLVPGSVSQAPGENLAPPPSPAKAKARSRSVKCKRGEAKRKGKCVKPRTTSKKGRAKKSDARYTATNRRGN